MIDRSGKTAAGAAVIVYVAAFVVGAIVMSFEMLGSRYLNPYLRQRHLYLGRADLDGAGGLVHRLFPRRLARRPRAVDGGAGRDRDRRLGLCVADPGLRRPHAGIPAGRHRRCAQRQPGRLLRAPVLSGDACSACIRRSRSACCCNDPQHSGRVSGTVYGINTLGSIVGTLATTFYLIPLMGSRAITISLGIGGIVAGLVLIAAARLSRRAPALLLAALHRRLWA